MQSKFDRALENFREMTRKWWRCSLVRVRFDSRMLPRHVAYSFLRNYSGRWRMWRWKIGRGRSGAGILLSVFRGSVVTIDERPKISSDLSFYLPLSLSPFPFLSLRTRFTFTRRRSLIRTERSRGTTRDRWLTDRSTIARYPPSRVRDRTILPSTFFHTIVCNSIFT